MGRSGLGGGTPQPGPRHGSCCCHTCTAYAPACGSGRRAHILRRLPLTLNVSFARPGMLPPAMWAATRPSGTTCCPPSRRGRRARHSAPSTAASAHAAVRSSSGGAPPSRRGRRARHSAPSTAASAHATVRSSSGAARVLHRQSISVTRRAQLRASWNARWRQGWGDACARVYDCYGDGYG